MGPERANSNNILKKLELLVWITYKTKITYWKLVSSLTEVNKRPRGGLNQTMNRVATAAVSPYKDRPNKISYAPPGTAKAHIWKSAARRKVAYKPKSPRNVIQENIRNVRKLNNINMLNKIDNDSVNYGKLNVHEKAKLLGNKGVDRGDDFIIFKRKNNKRKRFNEMRPQTSGHKRALSCVGWEKPKIEHPNHSKVIEKRRESHRACLTPANLRSLSICSKDGLNNRL